MTCNVYIGDYNETHMMVTCSEPGMEHELSEYFTFKVPGYQFMPAYKTGRWSGDIRLFNRQTQTLYKGLVSHVEKWAEKLGYTVEKDKSFASTEFTTEEALAFIKSLELPDWLDLETRDYQVESFVKAVQERRLTILSPTGSGKSLIIYLIARYYDLKTLIIVPTKQLVHQMSDDLKSYGYDKDIHLIYSGKDKNSPHKFSVTTWQSIFRLKKDFFEQFEVVIVDETHQAKANSIRSILEKCTKIKFRFGTTGTLDDHNANKWVIEGLLGPVHRVVTSSQLIEDKVLAKFDIAAIVLKYPEELCAMMKGQSYQNEINFIVGNEKRNRLIVNLVTKIRGNNLVLFNFVTKHGDPLHKMFLESTDRPIYYMHGGIDASIRNDMRAQIEKEKDAIIVGSIKAVATGTNIVKLDNIFFTAPSKSRITTLQAIGRVLRKSETKKTATLYDIVDSLEVPSKTGKSSRMNYALRHFFERLKIYKSENFPFKVYNTRIK